MPDLWSRIIMPQQRKFRIARAELIKRLAPDIQGASIIDVGGSLPFWREVGHILKPGSVRIFNISSHRMTMFEAQHEPWLSAELYDGTRLPVGDKAADFAMCHSVFGYVTPPQRQELAREIKRVARRFIVQTPAYGFPIELSSGLPFIHWLPRPLARRLVVMSPFNLLTDVNIREYFDHTWLLSRKDLQNCFSTAEITTERFLGFPKSYLAIGGG